MALQHPNLPAGARAFAWVAAVLALAAAPAISAGSLPTEPLDTPFSAQATAERVAQTLRTGRSSASATTAEPPEAPNEAAGPPMVWDELRRSLDAMQRWLAAYEARPQPDPGFTRPARAAQAAAEAAHTQMVQVQTDFAASLQRLGQAVQHMAAARNAAPATAPEAAWAVQMLNQFTAVGARLAADGLQRARTGGVDSPRMAAATHAYQNGLALMQRGQHGQAMGQFAPGITVGNVPVFNLDRFESKLNEAFGIQTVGYQYAIARDGVLARASVFGTTGLARTNADLPNTSQVATKEMNIASISKPITAMVLLRLLEQRKLSVDSPIAPWLPADWVLGEGIAGPTPEQTQLSFRDLLTHFSGLNQNLNGDYYFSDLQAYAQQGIVAADKLTRKYQNANFAMFRVAIPYLRYGANGVNQIAALVPFAPFDEVIAGLYIETVRDHAFEPTGFVTGGCVASDPIPTMSYPFPSNGLPGKQPGDWITRCGSGGWYLSSVELVGLMAFRRYTNLILSPASRQLMDGYHLGWAPADASPSQGAYGVYRHHGGSLTVSGPLDACYMEFFNGVQVAVNINSAGGNYLGNNSSKCDVLKWAFDNAFVAP